MNIIGSSTLKEAQQHPDKYKTLSVRVVGYSTYFEGSPLTVVVTLSLRADKSSAGFR